jgi:hypothetical protein
MGAIVPNLGSHVKTGLCRGASLPPSSTNHFAHSGVPADKGRAAEYEAGPYKGYGKKIQEAFAAIVPEDANGPSLRSLSSTGCGTECCIASGSTNYWLRLETRPLPDPVFAWPWVALRPDHRCLLGTRFSSPRRSVPLFLLRCTPARADRSPF